MQDQYSKCLYTGITGWYLLGVLEYLSNIVWAQLTMV